MHTLLENRKIRIVAGCCLLAVCVVFGFLLTSHGAYNWDDPLDYEHSRYLLHAFGIGPNATSPLRYFGTLSDTVLGIGSEIIFPWIHDPLWVRHALVLSGFFLFLLVTYFLLRKNSIHRSSALLSCIFIAGFIRLGGHAAVNVKDTPAACLYTLSLLFLWLAWRNAWEKDRVTWNWILWSSLLCSAVFLARIPLLLPIIVCCGGWAIVGTLKRTEGYPAKIVSWALPATVFFLMTFLLMPAVWQEGWLHTYLRSVSFYAHHDHIGPNMILGRNFPSPMPMPWWYPFLWIAVGFDPFTLPLVIIGIVATIGPLFFTKSGAKKPTERDTLDSASFIRWWWLVTALSFAVLIVARPNLYNEERHILFLYPLLAILGGVGWQQASKQIRWLIAAVSIVSIVWSYSLWREYSLYFESPLVTAFTRQPLNGDYWGICYAKAIRTIASSEWASQGTIIRKPFDEITRYRNETSLLPGWQKPIRYGAQVETPSYLYVGIGGWEPTMSDTRRSSEQILWEDRLPTGIETCSIRRITR